MGPFRATGAWAKNPTGWPWRQRCWMPGEYTVRSCAGWRVPAGVEWWADWPASSRWVAKLWRNDLTVTALLRPLATRACWRAQAVPLRLTGRLPLDGLSPTCLPRNGLVQWLPGAVGPWWQGSGPSTSSMTINGWPEKFSRPAIRAPSPGRIGTEPHPARGVTMPPGTRLAAQAQGWRRFRRASADGLAACAGGWRVAPSSPPRTGTTPQKIHG